MGVDDWLADFQEKCKTCLYYYDNQCHKEAKYGSSYNEIIGEMIYTWFSLTPIGECADFRLKIDI